MNRAKLLLATVAFFMMALPALAAPVQAVNVGLQDVIDTVEKSFRTDPSTGLSPLTTVTADFFQRSTLAAQKKELRADGQMFLRVATNRDPLMFRFDYFRPMQQEIVCNGSTLWIYLPENRQVIINNVQSVFNPYTFDPGTDHASNFLQGLPRLSRDFQITFSPQGRDIAGNYILDCTPRRSSVSVAHLYIVVSRDAVLSYVRSGRNIRTSFASLGQQEWAFPILSTTLVDHRDNTTVIEFSNVKTNILLSDGLFTFATPPGVEVVKPPRRH